MPICIFFGPDDNKPFKVWIEDNLNTGFYLNIKSVSEGVLHAAACDHVHDKNFEVNEHTSSKKVTSLEIGDLQAYADEQKILLTPCHRANCP